MNGGLGIGSSYTKKFISEKLPIIDAFKNIWPIWVSIIRYPRSFFLDLSDAPTIQLRQSIFFCLSTATAIAASIFTIYGLAQFVLKYFYGDNTLEKPDLWIWFMIEIGAFLIIFVYDAGSAIITYLSALCVLKRPSFKRIFVASLYMTTFLQTIALLTGVITIIVIMLTGVDREFDAMIRQPTFDVAEIILLVWLCVLWVWGKILSPALALSANVYVTGISPRLLMVGSTILIVIAYFLFLGISYSVYSIIR